MSKVLTKETFIPGQSVYMLIIDTYDDLYDILRYEIKKYDNRINELNKKTKELQKWLQK